MAHGKSLVENRAEITSVDPELYLPQFADGQIFRTEAYNPDFDLRHFAVAANAGRIIVARAFQNFVVGANNVEVFQDKLVDGARSAHGVRFGMIGDRNGLSVRVALKPFQNPLDAITEMDGYQRLQQLGVPAYDPIAVFPAQNGDHFISMTVKNNSLQSLDRSPWVVGRAGVNELTQHIAEENAEQIKGVAGTLAHIHSNGVFHPDGQIKNYVTSASGKIGIIDTESMIVAELGDEDSAQLAWNDIDKLVKSLVIEPSIEGAEDKIFGVGMLARLPLNLVRADIQDLIIVPYIEKLEEISRKASRKQQEQVELLSDGIVDRFYNDEQWPQHYIDVNRKKTKRS